MGKAVYVNIDESTKDVAKRLRSVLLVIDLWIKKHNTPVPKNEIIKTMEDNGVKYLQTEHALKLLLKQGYIRRAIGMNTNAGSRTSYVQLKRLVIYA